MAPYAAAQLMSANTLLRGRACKADEKLLIGNSSFSLYLVHPIVLNVFPKILLASGLGIAFKGWIIFALLIAIILIIAGICARFIERGLSAYLTKILLGNALKKNETIRQ
jgi:peptidoglycan/LPS O-acetylase OafA/YrhL